MSLVSQAPLQRGPEASADAVKLWCFIEQLAGGRGPAVPLGFEWGCAEVAVGSLAVEVAKWSPLRQRLGKGAGGNPLVLGLGPPSITLVNSVCCLQALGFPPRPRAKLRPQSCGLCKGGSQGARQVQWGGQPGSLAGGQRLSCSECVLDGTREREGLVLTTEDAPEVVQVQGPHHGTCQLPGPQVLHLEGRPDVVGA